MEYMEKFMTPLTPPLPSPSAINIFFQENNRASFRLLTRFVWIVWSVVCGTSSAFLLNVAFLLVSCRRTRPPQLSASLSEVWPRCLQDPTALLTTWLKTKTNKPGGKRTYINIYIIKKTKQKTSNLPPYNVFVFFLVDNLKVSRFWLQKNLNKKTR